MRKSVGALAGVGMSAAWVGAAAAQEPVERLTYGDVFAHAAPANQVLMLLLMGALVAALGLWGVARFRSAGPEPSRAVAGLRYLKGMWLGSLLTGLLGGSLTLMAMCIALANVRPAPQIHILAPGFAEITFQVLLGLLAAAVAVTCHNDLDARLRRLAETA